MEAMRVCAPRKVVRNQAHKKTGKTGSEHPLSTLTYIIKINSSYAIHTTTQ